MKSTPGNIGLKGSKQMPLYAAIRNPLIVKDRSDLVYRLGILSPEYKNLKKDKEKYKAERQKAMSDIEAERKRM